MDKIIKEFHGYSDSKIFLIQNSENFFIRKIGNIERNFTQMELLKNYNISLPKVYKKEFDTLEMEYLHGINIKNFLKINDYNLLLEFLIDLIEKLSNKTVIKDYTNIYLEKLNNIDFSLLPFTKIEFLSKLPTNLPQSIYHGDLTLENIIYSNNKFYLIDCLSSEYDSWVFDIAKLRQDLKCKWFLRNEENHVGLNSYLQFIDNALLNKYPILNNDNLIILMLLRIYPYTIQKKDLKTQDFILNIINKLWK